MAIGKKNILVVNDDGYEAAGIHKLAEALSDSGDIYVCSPHVQKSGTGHGITIGKPVYIQDIEFKGAKQAISMEGTPADCVKIGLDIFSDRGVEMDMVFSGFNHGHNLGTDTFYSGTVSAAVEGALCGLPSAAMSISLITRNHRTPEYFESAMDIAAKLAKSELFSKRLCQNPRPIDVDYINKTQVILNVNIPDFPAEKIRGTKVCPLSYRAYEGSVQMTEDSDGRAYYYYAGSPKVIGDLDADSSDVIANRLGYITITPLHFNLSCREMIEAMRGEWNNG